MIQRGGNRNYRYTPNARNTPDATVPQGMMGAMVPVPLEIGGVPALSADAGNIQPLPISALASALASAPPEQQRAVRSQLSHFIKFFRFSRSRSLASGSNPCIIVCRFRCWVSSCIL